MRVLPPGDYVARARIRSGTETLGELRRGFAVTGPATAEAAGASSTGTSVSIARPSAPISARAVGAVQPFALDQVLAPQVLGGFLERVAARPDASSPMIRDLVDRARTQGVADLYVSDTLAAESPVAAFLRGLALLSQKKYELAANAFRSAMRESPDFFPAMVYLGACYAAGGKDKEAAGAWQTAMIKEGDAVALHKLLTDAFLRQGSGDQALRAVETARAKWPQDEGLQRRFVIAALLGGKPAEALQALDTIEQKDEAALTLAVLVLYEAAMNGRPVESAEQDRARMLRLADTYRATGGPALPLIETWLAAATAKK
jgi:tetratricopeptide (TPR) repeat protein